VAGTTATSGDGGLFRITRSTGINVAIVVMLINDIGHFHYHFLQCLQTTSREPLLTVQALFQCFSACKRGDMVWSICRVVNDPECTEWHSAAKIPTFRFGSN